MLNWLLDIEPELISQIRPETRQKYISNNPLRNLLVQRFIDLVLGMVKRCKPETILDVGCGEGLVEYYLMKNIPGLSIWGSDLDREVLNIPSLLNPQGTYVHCDARSLPFKDKSMELVMLNEVLEHIENYADVISEADRVSSKSCIISVPQWPFYQGANFLIGKNLNNWGEHPDHVVSFTKKKLVKDLKDHFSSVLVRSSFPWIVAMCEK